MKKNYKSIYAILVSTISFLAVVFLMGFSIERPLVISQQITESIYSDNNFSYQDYLNIEDNHLEKEALAGVKYLTIDANTLGESRFLKYTTNIEELTITDYQNLTKEDLSNLKHLKSLKELDIVVDGNYALKNPNYKIDLSMFPNLEKVYITCNLINEIDSYISYNLIKDNNINHVDFRRETSLEEVKIWDQKIEEIVASLDLNNKNEADKVAIVSNYVMEYLQYDQNVYDYLLKTTRKNYSYKINEYNAKLLTPIINNDATIKDAICCNYAAFTNAILYKIGIESYYIVGLVGGGAHAWNIVNVEEEYYIVDLTFVDNASDYALFISDDMYEYDTYYEYSFPTINKVDEEPIYNDVTIPRYIIKLGSYTLNIM